jgi:hypothetical protein
MTTHQQHPIVIQAEQYGDTEAALAADPIIVGMAAGIPDDVDLSGWSFTTNALAEYRERGGTIVTHIGGPAAAIRALVAARS